MAAGADRGGGAAGGLGRGEARAAEAVHAQPVFRTPVMVRAETQSGRLADRWAPEGARAARGPAMRSLGFADHVIGTYLGEGVERARRAGPVDRPVARMDWLFPVPWYLDELDWLSAGRAAAWESQRAAVRSGEMSPARAARPVVSGERSVHAPPLPPEPAPVRFDLPLELVAPALAASRSPEASGQRIMRGAASAVRPALRAFAPTVDPAAARAAEFLAELYERNAAAGAARAGEGTRLVETAFRPAPILEYVAPAELVGPAEEASRSQIARAARETLEAARQAEAIAREDRVRAAAGSQAAAAAQAQMRAAEEHPAPEGLAVRAELARAEAARQVAPAAPSRRAIELLAASAVAGDGGERMALSAGPRVLLPAGLGGLYATADQSRAVHEPVAGPAATRRARSGSGGLYSPLSAARPAAIDHLVWSDRWLARFAGASSGALVSFDMARGAPSMRPGAAPWSQPALVTAPPARERRSLSSAAGAPERVLTAAAAAIVDDDQPVGDDVLAAIAAAAATERSERQRPARPRPPGPAELLGPFRASAADRSLARIALPGSAGLRPALGASPVAAVLSSLVGAATQAPFDARPLSIGSVSDFLARGGSRARTPAMAPSRALAAGAPGTTWLAMTPARGADLGRSPLRSVGGAAGAGAAMARAPREAPALSLVAPEPPGAAAGSAPAARRAAAASHSAARAALASSSAASVAMSAAPAAWLGSALSARPGSLAAFAEGFASARAAAAADLSLDFLSPEVLVAARAFGFSPHEAVRAQRLAAAGRPELTRLASLVDQVFVSALSPAGERERAGAAGLSAAEVAHMTPHRMPRGSFLMPSASSRALGVTASEAERTQPGIAAALELVAAGQVAEAAEVAGQRPAADRAASVALAGPGGAPTAPDAVSHEEARGRGDRMREAAQERAATDAARELLPRHLWSVFDAVYLSLGEETVASDVRPLGPAARAARALALASRARGPEDLPLSARARAAAAWAVLPVVMTGGVAAPSAAASNRWSLPVSGRAPRPAPITAPTRAAGGEAELPGQADASRRSGASRAGEALASLVAPSFFRADDRGDGYGPVSAERSRASSTPTTTLVETGTRPRPAPPPPPAPAPRPAPRPAPAAAAEPTKKEFEAWFQSAAKKYFGEAPSQSGLTVAEMTLVTSAPREQIAASEADAARSVPTQTMSGAAAGAGEGGGPGAAAPPNIDKIAQDVYDQICRMLAVARERSGDPWNR